MRRTARFLGLSVFLAGALVLVFNQGEADVLWDTGPASGNVYGRPGIYPFGFTLQGGTNAQYAAGMLHLEGQHTLTSIQGWMATDGSFFNGETWTPMNLEGGELTIGIYNYSQTTGLPDDLLARTNVFELADGSYPDWYGLTNLSINLQPGYYFISFEPVSDTFDGVMSTMHWINELGIYPPAFPPNPMISYAYYYEGKWNQYGGSYNTVGMRIEGYPGSGENNTVPEPVTMILFGSGLAGLAAVSRKRKIC